MVEIFEGIHSLDFSESKNHGMEMWILNCSEGVIIVDTGMRDPVMDMIESELASFGKAWADVEAVLITHTHGDHIGNLEKVKNLTGAKVYSHTAEAPDIKEQTGVDVEGLEHGAVLPYCGGIELVHVPGHTAGNCSYYLPEKKTLIAGDTIFGDDKGNLIVPPEKYSLDVKQATLELKRLSSYDFENLVYTHGKDILGNAKDKVESLIERTR
jgi:glyoxylase-like metal-dependent hydrolase (beta-lactamase superfamily II)